MQFCYKEIAVATFLLQSWKSRDPLIRNPLITTTCYNATTNEFKPKLLIVLWQIKLSCKNYVLSHISIAFLFMQLIKTASLYYLTPSEGYWQVNFFKNWVHTGNFYKSYYKATSPCKFVSVFLVSCCWSDGILFSSLSISVASTINLTFLRALINCLQLAWGCLSSHKENIPQQHCITLPWLFTAIVFNSDSASSPSNSLPNSRQTSGLLQQAPQTGVLTCLFR